MLTTLRKLLSRWGVSHSSPSPKTTRPPEVITLTDYWQGREKTHAEDLTPEIEAEAIVLLARVNLLLTLFGQRRRRTSGWRPPTVNAKTKGASKTSLHMTGQAIDLEDGNGELDDWLMSKTGEDALRACELWHEHPSNTRGINTVGGWCHLQSKSPPSGNLHFYR